MKSEPSSGIGSHPWMGMATDRNIDELATTLPPSVVNDDADEGAILLWGRKTNGEGRASDNPLLPRVAVPIHYGGATRIMDPDRPLTSLINGIAPF
jgi:hypothetical protein